MSDNVISPMCITCPVHLVQLSVIVCVHIVVYFVHFPGLGATVPPQSYVEMHIRCM